MKNSIDSVQVFGERNSGTNYLRKLLQDNYQDFKGLAGNNGFGWKHGDIGKPWCYYKNPPELYCHNIRDYKKDSKNTLFLIVYRNPITWLQSTNRSPHHAPLMYGLNFSNFLTSGWQSYRGPIGADLSKDKTERMSIIADKNKFEDYKNVFDLRRSKTNIFESFPKRVDNVVFLKYETARDHPVEVLDSISNIFSLRFSKSSYNQIDEDKFGYGKFKAKHYPSIKTSDFKLILESLDWIQEEKIGYKLNKRNAKSLASRPWPLKVPSKTEDFIDIKNNVRFVLSGKNGEIEI